MFFCHFKFFPSLSSNGYFSLFFLSLLSLLSRSLVFVFLKIFTLLSFSLWISISLQWSTLCSQETLSCEIPMPPTHHLLRPALAAESRVDPLGNPSHLRRMLRLQIRTPWSRIPNPRRLRWRARFHLGLRLLTHSSGSSAWRPFLKIRSLACLILVWRYITSCNSACFGPFLSKFGWRSDSLSFRFSEVMLVDGLFYFC